MKLVPYANAVGSIMYIMICTRPDMAYSMSLESRYIANLGMRHWEALKQILKYLKETSDDGLWFKRRDITSGGALVGFVDADYANVDNRRSQSAMYSHVLA